MRRFVRIRQRSVERQDDRPVEIAQEGKQKCPSFAAEKAVLMLDVDDVCRAGVRQPCRTRVRFQVVAIDRADDARGVAIAFAWFVDRDDFADETAHVVVRAAHVFHERRDAALTRRIRAEKQHARMGAAAFSSAYSYIVVWAYDHAISIKYASGRLAL